MEESPPLAPLPVLLVVDDEKNIRSTIRRALREKYEVHCAGSGEEALSCIEGGLTPHVILADMFMPGGMHGITLLEQSLSFSPMTKRILMTGHADLDLALTAVNQGHIHYFIRKPWDISELMAVLDQMKRMDALERRNELLVLELKYSNQSLLQSNRSLKEHQALLRQSLDERSQELLKLVRELEEVNRELKRKAIRDGLTGLYNHATIKTRLNEEIARAKRYGDPLSLIFLDIDHFKLYNDRLGHDVGDEVLVAVATFLLNGNDEISPSRTSDIIGRYGGEEFVIILPETTNQGALIRAERLRQGITTLTVPGAREQPLGCLSISAGVATFPQHSQKPGDLLKMADEALYRAKSSGRNQVQSAKPKAPHEERPLASDAAQCSSPPQAHYHRTSTAPLLHPCAAQKGDTPSGAQGGN